MRRLGHLSCAAALAAVLTFPAGAMAEDYAGTALNVIPSGQYGGLPVPADADQQAKMYDSLTPLFDQVTDADLATAFKSEKFGTDGQCPCKTEAVRGPASRSCAIASTSRTSPAATAMT